MDSSSWTYTSRTYGSVSCRTIAAGESYTSVSVQECSPTSMYPIFQNCPVACNSLCALTLSQYVTIIPSVGSAEWHSGHKVGIQNWFKFPAQSGKTYVIESDNDAKMYLYDSSLMSSAQYHPETAMLSATEDYHGNIGNGGRETLQRIEWTCAAGGEYAVLISQSEFDCTGNCDAVSLSITETSEAAAGMQTLHLDGFGETIRIGTACKIDGSIIAGSSTSILPVRPWAGW